MGCHISALGEDVKDPEMRHELEALQNVLQNLAHAVQNIGAEAEAAAEAVRAMGKEAGGVMVGEPRASSPDVGLNRKMLGSHPKLTRTIIQKRLCNCCYFENGLQNQEKTSL